MERLYSRGDIVQIMYGTSIVTAEVFAHINLSIGNNVAYIIRVGNQFFFIEKESIVEKS